jgi:hypothetical protein
MVTRRRLLLVTAGSLLAYGCAAPAPPPAPPTPPPGPPGPIPQGVLDAVSAILAGFQQMLPGLGFLAPELVAKITGWVTALQQIEAAVASGNIAGTWQQVVVNFAGTAQQILDALSSAGVALPSWLGLVVTAAQIALSFILDSIGTASSGRRAARAVSPAELARAIHTLRTVRPPPVVRRGFMRQ